MMKIICISDTHGSDFYDLVPECDILLHCGDISPMYDHSDSFQRQWFWDTFIPDLSKVPAKNIIFIAGNHDYFLQTYYKGEKENDIKFNLPKNVHYLRDTSVVIDGIKIHGTPWVTSLPRWAFNAPNNHFLDEPYSKISPHTDIIISHAPAYGYCDTIMEYDSKEKLGSAKLLEHIIRVKPKLVLCGHIHSGNHNKETLYLGSDAGTAFYNTSILDESYQINYKPLEININKGEIIWN